MPLVHESREPLPLVLRIWLAALLYGASVGALIYLMVRFL
jgi:hypothetical protein